MRSYRSSIAAPDVINQLRRRLTTLWQHVLWALRCCWDQISADLRIKCPHHAPNDDCTWMHRYDLRYLWLGVTNIKENRGQNIISIDTQDRHECCFKREGNKCDYWRYPASSWVQGENDRKQLDRSTTSRMWRKTMMLMSWSQPMHCHERMEERQGNILRWDWLWCKEVRWDGFREIQHWFRLEQTRIRRN